MAFIAALPLRKGSSGRSSRAVASSPLRASVHDVSNNDSTHKSSGDKGDNTDSSSSSSSAGDFLRAFRDATPGGRGRPRRRNNNNNNNGRGGRDAAPFQQFDGSLPMLPPWQPPTLEAAFTYRARGLRRRAGATEPLEDTEADEAGGAVEAGAGEETRHARWGGRFGRKGAGAEDERRLVSLHSPGYATLYAHVVQDDIRPAASTSTFTSSSSPAAAQQQRPLQEEESEGEAAAAEGRGMKRVWLRPLLLDDPDGGFVDVRGATDLVLPRRGVRDVDDPELRTRLRVNLAACEPSVHVDGAHALGPTALQQQQTWLPGGAVCPPAASEALMRFVRRLSEQQDGGEQTQ